jgi:hypothetical protein
VRDIGYVRKEEALPSSVKVAVAEKELVASYMKVSHVKVSAQASSELEEAVEPLVLLATSYLEHYLR